MNSSTTKSEADAANLRYCDICKKSKGHYTHQHEDWVKIGEEIKVFTNETKNTLVRSKL